MRSSRSPWSLLAAAPEQLEQEQEDVEDVEEDAGSYRDGAVATCSAQPVEVEDRERAEDAESRDGVDDVPVGDRDEDRDDPKRDQAEQRPEQRARPGGEVPARRVAVRATGGDERRGGSGRLP